MRRVAVVITARPTYSRIKSALTAIRDHPDTELCLIVAGSALLDRYGNTVNQIAHDGFDVAAQAFMVLEGENLTSMAKTTGIGLIELSTVFDNIAPDVVVTVADRYETLATAIAASYMNIPLAHVQGGEVSGSIDEKVRHAVTKLADTHFVSTAMAAERVVRMGEDPRTVHLTGCPSVDLAAEVLDRPDLDFDPYERYGGVGSHPSLADGYVVVLHHPVTTEYQHTQQVVWETLEAVAASGFSAVWFWPNVDAGSDGTSKAIRMFREAGRAAGMQFFKNMAPEDFLRLAFNSVCLVGNSSVGIREASFLGIPTVNIGTRQRGRERGPNVIDVSYDRDEILGAIRKHVQQGRPPTTTIYGDGNAGERIARLLATLPLEIDKLLAY